MRWLVPTPILEEAHARHWLIMTLPKEASTAPNVCALVQFSVNRVASSLLLAAIGGAPSCTVYGITTVPPVPSSAAAETTNLIHAIRVESELQLTIRELCSRGSGASLDAREGSMLAMTLLPGA